MGNRLGWAAIWLLTATVCSFYVWLLWNQIVFIKDYWP